MSQRQGNLLGAAALTAALQAEPAEGTALASACLEINLPLNIPSVEAAAQALEGQRERYEQAEQDLEVVPYLLRQYSGQVAWAEDYLQAAQAGEAQTQLFEIQAMRIGDLALVAYPGEMFVDYQLTMDRESPFSRTFTLGYTNGCIGYVPTEDAYPEGGYEVDTAFRYYGTLMITSDCERMVKETTFEMLEG